MLNSASNGCTHTAIFVVASTGFLFFCVKALPAPHQAIVPAKPDLQPINPSAAEFLGGDYCQI